VFGDRNVTGDVEDNAVVVTGDDNVLADDSTVIDGDFVGGFVGGDVAATQSALNFGDGDVAQDNSVDNSHHAKDSFNTDNSHHAKDSFNTDKSVNDSGNTTIKDSFDHEYTDRSDHSVNDSGNTDVDIDDSFQDNDNDSYTFEHEDNDTYSHEEKTYVTNDVDVDVDDSFQDNDFNDNEVDVEVD
jgi:hypothetical protein